MVEGHNDRGNGRASMWEIRTKRGNGRRKERGDVMGNHIYIKEEEGERYGIMTLPCARSICRCNGSGVVEGGREGVAGHLHMCRQVHHVDVGRCW